MLFLYCQNWCYVISRNFLDLFLYLQGFSDHQGTLNGLFLFHGLLSFHSPDQEGLVFSSSNVCKVERMAMGNRNEDGCQNGEGSQVAVCSNRKWLARHGNDPGLVTSAYQTNWSSNYGSLGYDHYDKKCLQWPWCGLHDSADKSNGEGREVSAKTRSVLGRFAMTHTGKDTQRETRNQAAISVDAVSSLSSVPCSWLCRESGDDFPIE